MEASLKAKWIEALRSGKYKQGRWALRTRSGKYKQGRWALRTKSDDFCCLGVLCDISGVSKWEENGQCYSYDGALCLLPPCLRNQLTREAKETLMEMNDYSGMSFPHIADWIKTNIPEDDQ